MKPNTQLVHAAVMPVDLREDWVQMQLTEKFIEAGKPTLLAGTALIALILSFLYGHVETPGLLLWGSVTFAFALARYGVLMVYRYRLKRPRTTPLLDFRVRFVWMWPLSGMAWGSSMYVFFMKAPIYDQFLCLMVLGGVAGFSIGSYSACLRCFSGFVHGLSTAVLTVVVYQFILWNGTSPVFNLYAMATLILIYWATIVVTGRRFHSVQHANFELQFDNETLISSLTEKTRSAVEAVAVKNRLIASAAHDLRQPVHALNLYAGWLAEEPESVEQIAPKIVRSTRAVSDLFDSLFDLAGLEGDPLRVQWQEVDLAGLIKDLELQYVPIAKERGLQLRIRVKPLTVVTDPVLLKRLVGNLVSNALRNTPKGGVLMALRKKQGFYCIEVWDTGVGIAPEHQQAIFQEFYRVPMQGTEEGFGLGLAIVTRLSNSLGHPVHLESRVGRGSVFKVELKAGLPSPVKKLL